MQEIFKIFKDNLLVLALLFLTAIILSACAGGAAEEPETRQEGGEAED